MDDVMEPTNVQQALKAVLAAEQELEAVRGALSTAALAMSQAGKGSAIECLESLGVAPDVAKWVVGDVPVAGLCKKCAGLGRVVVSSMVAQGPVVKVTVPCSMCTSKQSL